MESVQLVCPLYLFPSKSFFEYFQVPRPGVPFKTLLEDEQLLEVQVYNLPLISRRLYPSWSKGTKLLPVTSSSSRPELLVYSSPSLLLFLDLNIDVLT